MVCTSTLAVSASRRPVGPRRKTLCTMLTMVVRMLAENIAISKRYRGFDVEKPQSRWSGKMMSMRSAMMSAMRKVKILVPTISLKRRHTGQLCDTDCTPKVALRSSELIPRCIVPAYIGLLDDKCDPKQGEQESGGKCDGVEENKTRDYTEDRQYHAHACGPARGPVSFCI